MKLPTERPLTARQSDVLVLLGKGCSDKEIARALEIGRWAVNGEIRGIYSRLGVNTRVEAAVWAAKAGLL